MINADGAALGCERKQAARLHLPVDDVLLLEKATERKVDRLGLRMMLGGWVAVAASHC